MEKNFEIRHFKFENLEVKKRDNDTPLITGHAAVFDQLSEEMWGFQEKIEHGAFATTLRNKDDVRALINHDANFVLGRSTVGTLKMTEDHRGLYVEIDPPTTSFAADILVSLERGDVDQMSFGFIVTDERWEKKDKINIRVIEGVKLFDVSIVTFPAYPQTDAQVNSLWTEAGISFEDLARVITRSIKGLEIDSEDKEILKRSIEQLKSLKGVKEESNSTVPGNGEEQTPGSQLELLKLKQKQLKLRS